MAPIPVVKKIETQSECRDAEIFSRNLPMGTACQKTNRGRKNSQEKSIAKALPLAIPGSIARGKPSSVRMRSVS